MGRGLREKEVRDIIEEFRLDNVELIVGKLPWREMVRKMRECHVSLGQFENNPRLERTIPHKAFESLALKLPYLTADGEGTKSILEADVHCVYVDKAKPDELAEKILLLKKDAKLADKIAENGYGLFREKFAPEVLAKELLNF